MRDDGGDTAASEGLQPAPMRPALRGRLHQAALFVVIPAGAALVAVAHTETARTVTAVYAASLVGLYGVSTAYHRLRASHGSGRG